MMNKILIWYFKTEAGELVLGDYDNKLCICDWSYRKMRTRIDQRIKNELDAEFVEKRTDTIKEAEQQLTEYITKKTVRYDHQKLS